MKSYRPAIFLAAVLVTAILAWAFAREDIGAQESAAIEASAP
jgi:hypothetical protein